MKKQRHVQRFNIQDNRVKFYGTRGEKNEKKNYATVHIQRIGILTENPCIRIIVRDGERTKNKIIKATKCSEMPD